MQGLFFFFIANFFSANAEKRLIDAFCKKPELRKFSKNSVF